MATPDRCKRGSVRIGQSLARLTVKSTLLIIRQRTLSIRVRIMRANVIRRGLAVARPWRSTRPDALNGIYEEVAIREPSRF